MRKIKITLFCLLVLSFAVTVLCACNAQPVASGDDSQSTQGSVQEDVVPTDERINTVESGAVKIHKISELNTENEGIDSHKGLEAYSSLELNQREYSELTGTSLGGISTPYYSRIRRMSNGQYIMVYQANRISWEVFYAVSDDGVVWKNPKKLFATCPHVGGYNDTMIFMTADLCVLDDGTILVVSGFRGKANYSKDVNSNGIVVVRSTDNAKTWSEKKIIYTGTNWEPSVMQTSSGEVHVYFTQTGHLLAIHGWSADRRSSCVGLIRSSDRGLTWTETKNYSAQIVMQQFVYNKNGYDYMTDQMPVAVELHDGTIALAVEGLNAQDSYRLSIGYSKDNWPNALGFNEPGPGDRLTNFMQAAGPYIDQFDSGETILSCHRSEMFTYIGNASAKGFTNEYQPFEGHKGHWASVFVDSSHSVMATMANTLAGDIGSPTATMLDVGRLYLNHAIFAKKSSITVDGKTEDWDNNTSALFIGSETQAQMSMRFSYDDEKVYFLIERLDEYLTEADSEGIYIADEKGGYYLIKFNTSGVDSVSYYDGDRMRKSTFENIEWAMTIVGGVADKERDTGKILEIAIPRSELQISADSLLMFNATLYNKDKNEKTVSDGFSNSEPSKVNTWQRIYLTK